MASVVCKSQYLLICRLPLDQLGYTLVISADVACSFSLVSVNAGKKPGIGPAKRTSNLHSGTILSETKFLTVQWAEALYELMGQSALETGSAWLETLQYSRHLPTPEACL